VAVSVTALSARLFLSRRLGCRVRFGDNFLSGCNGVFQFLLVLSLSTHLRGGELNRGLCAAAVSVALSAAAFASEAFLAASASVLNGLGGVAWHFFSSSAALASLVEFSASTAGCGRLAQRFAALSSIRGGDQFRERILRASHRRNQICGVLPRSILALYRSCLEADLRQKCRSRRCHIATKRDRADVRFSPCEVGGPNRRWRCCRAMELPEGRDSESGDSLRIAKR
jgi:hypothetical protein